MAESVSYWICSCGKSNLNSTKICNSCKKRRPKRWLLSASIVLSIFAIVIISNSGSELLETSETSYQSPQKNFLARIEQAKSNAESAANPLAASGYLETRDAALSNTTIVRDWTGTVVGIQKMQGKGAISIGFGGVKLVAGIHLRYGLDTLISPSERGIYDGLLSLKVGDSVTFSGRLATYNGAVVELSYTDSGSLSSPEFLFEFSSISIN